MFSVEYRCRRPAGAFPLAPGDDRRGSPADGVRTRAGMRSRTARFRRSRSVSGTARAVSSMRVAGGAAAHVRSPRSPPSGLLLASLASPLGPVTPGDVAGPGQVAEDLAEAPLAAAFGQTRAACPSLQQAGVLADPQQRGPELPRGRPASPARARPQRRTARWAAGCGTRRASSSATGPLRSRGSCRSGARITAMACRPSVCANVRRAPALHGRRSGHQGRQAGPPARTGTARTTAAALQ